MTVTGPACTPGAAPLATADAGAAIDERDEDDNVLAAACSSLADRRDLLVDPVDLPGGLDRIEEVRRASGT